MKFKYDVIVIGGGHAGCEAACAAANLGSETLLLTADMNTIAQMSCNPAVGGIAKGQIVREIDALGGKMGVIADRTSIQFRMLNRSKGPAVWSPRVQSDRTKFIEEWRKILDSTDNLYIFQDMAVELVFDTINGKTVVKGVKTKLGLELKANKIILTNGTFLNGLMHFGENKISGGRISEAASFGISDQLKKQGFKVQRMKTGTPPRVDGRTIDFSLAVEQKGDSFSDKNAPKREIYHKFSFLPGEKTSLKQRSCYLVNTNNKVHEILKQNLDRSPLYNGQINSIGPRYCPSIETKIVTFSDKESHQLFLEPEGETTEEFYINGFSSSLPWEVQFEALRQIPALKDVNFYRPGYAIEYDYFDPTQLRHDLQTKQIEGLYFAGQINGTTGYEEAAAQGLMAGINASLSVKGKGPLVLQRDQAYIGVLIDDLVIKGVDEPYRMFTSRAEYRILLRQDDADLRLTPIGREIGLVDDMRWNLFQNKKTGIENLLEYIKCTKISPSFELNNYLDEMGSQLIQNKVGIAELVKRPSIQLERVLEYEPGSKNIIGEIPEELQKEIINEVEIIVKYEGYISREKDLAEKTLRLENVKIPDKFNYNEIKQLSIESRQKLSATNPPTIGAASRIPGVSPADIQILLLLLRN